MKLEPTFISVELKMNKVTFFFFGLFVCFYMLFQIHYFSSVFCLLIRLCFFFFSLFKIQAQITAYVEYFGQFTSESFPEDIAEVLH